MKYSRFFSPRWLALAALLTLGPVLLSGCSRTEAAFVSNEVFIKNQERQTKVDFNEQRKADLAEALAGLFGTPDKPLVPKLGDLEVQRILDENKLAFAAGPVHSDERGRTFGLYREHCAHCHGVTGDGAGPTAAFLNPYPRDYRLGVFKFKSTPRGFKPTHDDLMQVLTEGIPGTAMPSFKVLPQNELEALAQYVRYLSIRGEVERLLVTYTLSELDDEDRLFDLAGAEAERAEQASLLRDLTSEIVEKWLGAEENATPIPAPDPDRDIVASARRGRELFYGAIASCSKCHGDSALGDGQITDYDDWTKDIEPTDPEALAEYLSLGGFVLPPRNIRPRNLRQGIYRGGRRPIDLYWRIHNGIDGTPMPGAPMRAETDPDDGMKLNPDDIWALVDYVTSLPYESISRAPVVDQATSYQRERQ